MYTLAVALADQFRCERSAGDARLCDPGRDTPKPPSRRRSLSVRNLRAWLAFLAIGLEWKELRIKPTGISQWRRTPAPCSLCHCA